MPELTRDQHLAWCKQRALAYLPADPANAMASMLSDLTKHVGTREHPGRELAPMFYGSRNPAEVRRWIEGFN